MVKQNGRIWYFDTCLFIHQVLTLNYKIYQKDENWLPLHSFWSGAVAQCDGAFFTKEVTVYKDIKKADIGK